MSAPLRWSSLWSVLCLALTAAPVLSADGPPTSAPALYQTALKHLNDGHWYEDAMAGLQEAIRQDPKNPQYHLALGCAEVDRASSLAYAAHAADEMINAQESYKREYAYWQKGQQDPNSDRYGKPPPTAPPLRRFQIKDDLRYLRLTGKQAVARTVVLGLAAQDEWKQGVALTHTPSERAAAEYVQGWGLRLELRLMDQTGYVPDGVSPAPIQEGSVAAFTAAAKDAPDTAVYWESLGDAYGRSHDEAARAVAAFARALQLKPHTPGLGWQMAQAQMTADPKAAVETLKTLARSDPGNAYLQYEVAALLFKQVHYSDVYDRGDPGKKPADFAQELAAKDDAASRRTAQEALAAMELGNAAYRYEVPVYKPPVPALLKVAWNYWTPTEYSFSSGARFRELARASTGYAEVAVRRGEPDQAIRAANACVGMGQRMVENTPADGTQRPPVITRLIGLSIMAIGYRERKSVEGLAGGPGAVAQAEAEYAAAQKRMDVYREAIFAPSRGGYEYENY